MTDEEINIALAKWMGYADFSYTNIGLGETLCAMVGPEQESMSLLCVPSYTTSLDALAPLEARLTDEQWDRYLDEVMEVVGFNRRHIFSATAAQKARALVRALGLDGREG